METRIRGFVDVTVSFPDKGGAHGPPPPADTTPCGSCSYNATTKWLYGVCSETFEGYPVTAFSIKLLDAEDTVIYEQEGLYFIDIISGKVSETGQPRFIMSQPIETEETEHVETAVLSWRNATGQLISHPMAVER